MLKLNVGISKKIGLPDYADSVAMWEAATGSVENCNRPRVKSMHFWVVIP